MKKIQLELYTYSELDAQAKEKALAWYRRTTAFDYRSLEHVLDDACTVAAIVGLDVRNCHDHPPSHTIRYGPLLHETHTLCGFSGELRPCGGTALDRLVAYAPNDRKLHDTLRRLTKLPTDLVATVAPRNAAYPVWAGSCVRMQPSDVHSESQMQEYQQVITDCLHAFATWVYKKLGEEFVHQTSDESLEEFIEFNQHTFTKAGEAIEVTIR